jgi:hypothetical protein
MLPDKHSALKTTNISPPFVITLRVAANSTIERASQKPGKRRWTLYHGSTGDPPNAPVLGLVCEANRLLSCCYIRSEENTALLIDVAETFPLLAVLQQTSCGYDENSIDSCEAEG